VIVGAVVSSGMIVLVVQIVFGAGSKHDVAASPLNGDVTCAVVVKPGSLTLVPPSSSTMFEPTAPIAVNVIASAGNWKSWSVGIGPGIEYTTVPVVALPLSVTVGVPLP